MAERTFVGDGITGKLNYDDSSTLCKFSETHQMGNLTPVQFMVHKFNMLVCYC